MDRDEVRYCMRCLEPLTPEGRRRCFKCNLVTCDRKSCGTWAVLNRFWSCQICVNQDIEAIIDLHDNKLEPEDEE